MNPQTCKLLSSPRCEMYLQVIIGPNNNNDNNIENNDDNNTNNNNAIAMVAMSLLQPK